MNDRVLLDNYLMILKSTIEVYVHGTLESSNKEIRNLLKNGLDETIKHQANTYDKMTEFGWYTITNVSSKEINQTLNSLQSEN